MTALFVSFSFFKEWEWLRYSRGSQSTWAAFDFRNAIGVFADQLAFRFRACRFLAFPVAFWFFTDWFAFWFRCLTVGNAMGLLAYSNTFWAVEHFTAFVWAFYLALWFFTLNVADSILWLSAWCVASWGFADWIADSGAMWVIALPRALGMALLNCLY